LVNGGLLFVENSIGLFPVVSVPKPGSGAVIAFDIFGGLARVNDVGALGRSEVGFESALLHLVLFDKLPYLVRLLLLKFLLLLAHHRSLVLKF
jgi:hypothetical protein